MAASPDCGPQLVVTGKIDRMHNIRNPRAPNDCGRLFIYGGIENHAGSVIALIVRPDDLAPEAGHEVFSSFR
jgi:hypothetical protein